MVLGNFAGTKHFERCREENVIGRNVIKRFHCRLYALLKRINMQAEDTS